MSPLIAPPPTELNSQPSANAVWTGLAPLAPETELSEEAQAFADIIAFATLAHIRREQTSQLVGATLVVDPLVVAP